MFEFEHIKYLYLLLVIPLLLGVFLFRLWNRMRNLKKFGNTELVISLIPDYSSFRIKLKFLLQMLAVAVLIMAIAGPRAGSKLTKVKRKGMDIMVALDVSNSMMAEDIKPNRLERAKQELARLIDRLEDDHIGLIVFAGDAYTQLPITNDFVSAKMFLSGINTGMVSRQGTNIGSAIELAIRSFSSQSKAGKAIVIISDGENHEGGVEEACKKASEKGIRIFTVGMGTEQGSRIPVTDGTGNRDFRRDKDGNFVVTRMDEEMLRDLASRGDGKYYQANMPNMGLTSMLEQLNKMNTEEYETKVYSEYNEQFPYYIWLVLLLLLADLLLLDKKNRKLGNFRIFETK
jgi:Ca-activated chloride channel family protein